jgi:hypothetical protein
MTDRELTLALAEAAEERMQPVFRLMDDHHQAPGHILFAVGEEGRYIAYLKHTADPENTVPLIYAFELLATMDKAAVLAAFLAAQETFTREIRNIRRAMKPAILPVQGNDQEPVLWNGDLTSFGQNPFGQNRWRVIWAPSRVYLVGGRWTDREEGKIVRTVDEYRWIPRYGGDEGWILEKWLSAMEYAGTKEAWDMQNMDPETAIEELGPYPTQGVYEAAWKFPAYPTASEVERCIQMVRYGKEKYSKADIRDAHRNALEGKEKARGDNFEAMVRDAMPAFPLRAISGSPYRSGPDPIRLTTKDLPRRMPQGDKDFRQV